jgi:hypothetical protein
VALPSPGNFQTKGSVPSIDCRNGIAPPPKSFGDRGNADSRASSEAVGLLYLSRQGSMQDAQPKWHSVAPIIALTWASFLLGPTEPPRSLTVRRDAPDIAKEAVLHSVSNSPLHGKGSMGTRTLLQRKDLIFRGSRRHPPRWRFHWGDRKSRVWPHLCVTGSRLLGGTGIRPDSSC